MLCLLLGFELNLKLACISTVRGSIEIPGHYELIDPVLYVPSDKGLGLLG
jgi:hypothetical protein